MDNTRLQRWVRASHALASIEPFMVLTVQGLGKIDAELFHRDQQYREFKIENNTTVEEGIDLTGPIILSYLWVLGAYEVIRTVNQRFKAIGELSAPNYIRSQELKKLFERIRIPLAKLEPSNRHKKTDSSIAYPALTPAHGIAWQISENHIISRGELSTALEWLRNKHGN